MRSPPASEPVLETNLAEEVWDTYVLAHEDANYCHLSGWKRVFHGAYSKECHYLALTVDGGVRGVVPLVHMKGIPDSGTLVSLPYLDGGGILADGRDMRATLFESSLQLSRSVSAKRVSFRGPNREEGEDEPPTDRFRFILPLGSSEEDLWSRIGGKVRNQIRKSQKSNLRTSQVAPQRLRDFYRIFSINMRDLGSPVHSREFFRLILDVFRDRARLFLTEDESGRPVAGAISLDFRQQRCVPWASSLREARSACPNHSLYWSILLNGLQNDCETFDFGRSSVGSGTFHFKKQWGAEAEPLHWRSVDLAGVETAEQPPSPADHPWVTRLWRRIPLKLTTLLGPMIRQRLSN